MGRAPRLVERLLLLGQSMASISSQSRETVRAGIPSCSQETDEPRPGWRSNTSPLAAVRATFLDQM